MEPEPLKHWFHQRRVLQEWVQQQPNVNSSSVRSMFYGDGAENGQLSPPESMPPPVAPWQYVQVLEPVV